MVEVDFYLMDIDSVNDEEGKAVIRLFGKTLNNERIVVLDKNFKPYFFLIIKKYSDDFKKLVETAYVEKGENKYYVEKVLKVKRKYLGKEIEALKVYVNNPASISYVKEVLEGLENVYGSKEVDIQFYKRYLIDKNITPLTLCRASGEVSKSENDNIDFIIDAERIEEVSVEDNLKNPRVLAFDIEAYITEHNYPKVVKDPIIMISFYGNDGFSKVLVAKKFKTDKKYIESFNSEEEILIRFKEIIKEYKPDYLVGYFSDEFDMPYIVSRAKKYNLRLDLGLDNSIVKISKRGFTGSAKIKGLIHLDIFKFISKTMVSSLQTDSLNLDSVARELIGEGKIEVDIEELGEIWKKGGKELERFCEYNLNDSVITTKVFLKLLPNLNELTKLVGQPVHEVCRMSYGQLVENYLMRRLKEFNEIYPNKPTLDEIRRRRFERYAGAFVFEPEPGFYRNIAVLDFKSLYPSLFVAYNVCISSLNDEKDGYETPDIDKGKEKVKYYFSSKEEGFIPVILRDLITRRNRIKEIMDKEKRDLALEARSYALKTLANAAYGYTGFFGARWYCKECAEGVTALGRKYLQDLIDEARKKDFHVIYADTDSVFIDLETRSKKDVISFLKEINRTFPSLIELELEDFYPMGIFVSKKSEVGGAKKRYALLTRDNDIKIRGFETVRRNWSYIAKETQRKVFELILKENSKEKALEFVKKVISDIKNKKINIKLMVIKTQLQKSLSSYDQIGPHVAIARKMKMKGFNVEAGSIIRYVVTEGKGMIRDRAKLLSECSDKEYDANYYINNQILPGVERIFEILGYKKEDLLDSGQYNLKRFM